MEHEAGRRANRPPRPTEGSPALGEL